MGVRPGGGLVYRIIPGIIRLRQALMGPIPGIDKDWPLGQRQ